MINALAFFALATVWALLAGLGILTWRAIKIIESDEPDNPYVEGL